MGFLVRCGASVVLTAGGWLMIGAPSAPAAWADTGANPDPGAAGAFVAAVNGVRQSHGLAPLSVSGGLSAMAQSWASSMAGAGTISHNPGLSSQAPAGWLKLGENVGVGPDVSSLEAAFVNSPEHYQNMVDPSFGSIGVGVVTNSSGVMYVTEDYMQTTPAPAPVASAPAATPTPAAAPVAPPAPTASPSPQPVPVSSPASSLPSGASSAASATPGSPGPVPAAVTPPVSPAAPAASAAPAGPAASPTSATSPIGAGISGVNAPEPSPTTRASSADTAGSGLSHHRSSGVFDLVSRSIPGGAKTPVLLVAFGMASAGVVLAVRRRPRPATQPG